MVEERYLPSQPYDWRGEGEERRAWVESSKVSSAGAATGGVVAGSNKEEAAAVSGRSRRVRQQTCMHGHEGSRSEGRRSLGSIAAFTSGPIPVGLLAASACNSARSEKQDSV